ncbi:MAG: glycosyltransferase family 2 protein [Sphingomonadales bacterium]|nr:glycosyltransferase family 2 protein [Sphingomonadales bacterium]
MTSRPMVTTIIPTTASSNRTHSLQRAIESIRASSSTPLAIVVVVNGRQFDNQICRWMENQPDVMLDFLEEPSLTSAILKGRQLVRTRFFSFLDDDDEYLPGSIDKRRAVLEESPGVDLVVVNGFRREGGADRLAFNELPYAISDPLTNVFKAIWLCSCNALYRTASVNENYFRELHARAEWTWLAFNLALDGKKVSAIDAPGFRIHDTPGSLSKSQEYQDAYLALYQRMLLKTVPTTVARLIKKRASSAWHDRSVQALNRGDRMAALTSHTRSLLLPGGLRYLSYTRHLLR